MSFGFFSCRFPDGMKQDIGQASHTLLQPSTTVHGVEEVSVVEVKWVKNKQSAWGIAFIIAVFLLQTLTCSRVEAALTKCRSLFSSCWEEGESVEPPAEAEESSESVAAVVSQEDSDALSFSSEVSRDTVQRPVPFDPGLDQYNSSGLDNLSESLPWIDLSVSEIPSAPPAPPSESSSDTYGRDNPPPYCSLQPLSCTLLEPPPYEALRSPLYSVLHPPSYEEAILDASRASPDPSSSSPRSHAYSIGDPAINTPATGSDTDRASDRRRY